MSDKDLVVEARDFVVTSALRTSPDRARGFISALCDEVERLKRGDFTEEEFQNLCHNTDIQAGFDVFADGCEAYQQKMFGRCRKARIT